MPLQISQLPSITRPAYDIDEYITLTITGNTDDSLTYFTNIICTVQGGTPEGLFIEIPLFNSTDRKTIINVHVFGSYPEEFKDYIYFVDKGYATTVDQDMNYIPRYPDKEQAPQVVQGFQNMPPNKDIFCVKEDQRGSIEFIFDFECSVETYVTPQVPSGRLATPSSKLYGSTNQIIYNNVGSVGASLRQYLRDNK